MRKGYSGLSEADAHVVLREFEDRHRLFHGEVEGTCLWQLVRFEVSVQLQHVGLPKPPLSRKRLLGGLAQGLVSYLLPASRVRFLSKTFDSAHRNHSEAGFRDIYFDDLWDSLQGGAKMSSCDTAGYEEQISQAYSKPVFDDTAIIAMSALLGRQFPVLKDHPYFEKLANLLKNELGVEGIDRERLSSLFNVFMWRSRLYQRVLKKFNPKAVLVPDSGQFALMKACNNIALPFIELQHGLFTSMHPNALPAHASRRAILRPTVLAAYGSFTKQNLKNTLLEKEGRIRPVGAAFIEAPAALRRSLSPVADLRTIIVTTQGIDREKLSDYLASMMEAAGPNVRLSIKLHPAYDTDETIYRNRFGSDDRVSILSAQSSESTHMLVAKSNLHLSISSATHYDALGIGTPTAVVPLASYGSVNGILDHEGAFLAADPFELGVRIRSGDIPVVPESVKNFFFQSGFIGNMQRLLDGIASIRENEIKTGVRE